MSLIFWMVGPLDTRLTCSWELLECRYSDLFFANHKGRHSKHKLVGPLHGTSLDVPESSSEGDVLLNFFF